MQQVMDYDERSIRIFLKSYPGQFVSARVISRRLGGRRRYHEDPLWVMPFLNRLVDKGIVESDAQGHFRLRPRDPISGMKRTWVSPQVKRILDRSSKDFAKVINLDDDEEEEELV
jgi:predicted transcriptional regulator